MNILFMDWFSYGNEDIIEIFEDCGYTVECFTFPQSTESTRFNPELSEKIIRRLAEKKYEFVFSFNYFPVVSLACNAARVRYVAWVYDSPFIQLYSNTISFTYNYVFIFDKAVYRELKGKGIDTVYYLPMAAPVQRYDQVISSKKQQERFSADVSFVGSTYHEKKNQLFQRLAGIDDYTMGFLDGIIQAQKNIYGYNFLEELLTPDIVEKLQEVCLIEDSTDGFDKASWTYANYFLARRVTALERMEILKLISERFQLKIYTQDMTDELSRAEYMGTVEYYAESPLVFKNSKINLNITLRSIITGMPLRALDIMGCQGFLLSNYQEDFLEFFEPGVDFVFYEDYEDLLEKTAYYLEHEEERKQIARNGYLKVKQFHTYRNRVETILSILQEKEPVSKQAERLYKMIDQFNRAKKGKEQEEHYFNIIINNRETDKEVLKRKTDLAFARHESEQGIVLSIVEEWRGFVNILLQLNNQEAFDKICLLMQEEWIEEIACGQQEIEDLRMITEIYHFETDQGTADHILKERDSLDGLIMIFRRTLFYLRRIAWNFPRERYEEMIPFIRQNKISKEAILFVLHTGDIVDKVRVEGVVNGFWRRTYEPE